MANPLAITLHALGQEVANGQSTAVDIEAIRSAAHLTLVVTAATGGSVSVSVETSPDGTTGWRQVGAFSVFPAAASEEISVDRCDRFLRVAWTLSTNATFSVIGNAHQLFVQRKDVVAEIGEQAVSGVTGNDFANALIKASVDIEDALNSAYVRPITAVSQSVRQAGGAIAAFRIMNKIGWDPDNPADEIIRDNAREARSWLMKVAQGTLKPPGIVDSTPTKFEAAAAVVSRPARGW